MMPQTDDIIYIDKLNNDKKYFVGDKEKKIFVLFLSGSDHRGALQIFIKGKNAQVTTLGIILGFGKQNIHLTVRQEHQNCNNSGNLLIKSVLFDQAEFFFNGMIKIAQKSQKIYAYQKNQNLLMSDKAWVTSQPFLEILASDVSCTHGCTIGKIDEDQLSYLASRGIKREEAEKIIVQGFLQEVLVKIPDKKIQSIMTNKITATIVNYYSSKKG